MVKNVIKEWRIKNNISQSILADMLNEKNVCLGNIRKGTVSMWENGKHIPVAYVLDTLAEVLNMTSKELKSQLQEYQNYARSEK